MLNADVNHAGSVHFRSLPGSSQTEIRVILCYEPPCGDLGAWIAELSGIDPETQVQDGLHRFKRAYESSDCTRSGNSKNHGFCRAHIRIAGPWLKPNNPS